MGNIIERENIGYQLITLSKNEGSSGLVKFSYDLLDLIEIFKKTDVKDGDFLLLTKIIGIKSYE